MPKSPTAQELLATIESKGFVFTLELRHTPQKWVTGMNYFLGISKADGAPVRNAYGPIALELPRAIAKHLVWEVEDRPVENASKALRHAIELGKIRRSSHIHNALIVASHFPFPAS